MEFEEEIQKNIGKTIAMTDKTFDIYAKGPFKDRQIYKREVARLYVVLGLIS